jgi:signal transduction histidine kinase
MKQDDEKIRAGTPYENLLVTTQRKLLKPRLQNKLILAFVSTAVISIALSTYLVIRITAEFTERQIEEKIRGADASALSEIDRYEEQALVSLSEALEMPRFSRERLEAEKAPWLYTPPITAGSEALLVLWVPSGQPIPGSGPPAPRKRIPIGATKAIMLPEIENIQTLLAGAMMPIADEERQYGTLLVGYTLGKSFAQDLEIMTGVDIRIFYEKEPAAPPSILFEGSSSGLSQVAVREIKQIASIMREHRKLKLIIEGHTDSTGSEKQNYSQGLKRAEAVKEALVEEGIAASRLQTTSFGETRAIAPEVDEKSRALNRRVELELKSREAHQVGAIEDLPMTSDIRDSLFVKKTSHYERDALFKGEAYRAIYRPLVDYRGKVVGLIFVGMPRKYTFAATVTASHVIPIILCVGFLLATVIGYTISRSISRPIRHLYRGVLSVADGDLDQHFEDKTKDEIGDLGRAFNIMTRKLRQLKELEQEVQRRDRLAALGELSAGVAHEIRNPLGVIKNSAEMLRDRIDDDAKRRELTGFIVEEVERLNRVVTNFLQFARPAEPNIETVNINDVLEYTISFLEPKTESSGVNIDMDLEPELPPVSADPDQCRQVFLNLFMNAFQAMNGAGAINIATRPASDSPAADGGGAGADEFSPDDSVAEQSNGRREMVEIVIADTGQGIDPEDLPRVFDPFFSTKDEGVGLGLSLVHKMIENNDGHIRVNSRPGEGTTFVISLPVARTDESEG